MATKHCSKCGVQKPYEAFAPDKKMRSGRASWCRDCMKAAQSQRRKQADFKAKRKEYRRREAVRQKSAEYYRQWAGPAERVAVAEKACSKCGAVKPGGDFSANRRTRDGLASWCKACVARKSKENRQKPEVKARAAAYARLPSSKERVKRYKQTERFKKWMREYSQTDKYKAVRVRCKARRRARESETVNDLTGWDWNRILKAQDRKCYYCARPFGPDLKPTADHVVPVAKGGHTTRANIVAACMSCNCSKRDREKPSRVPTTE